jgi:hypothetical protein
VAARSARAAARRQNRSHWISSGVPFDISPCSCPRAGSKEKPGHERHHLYSRGTGHLRRVLETLGLKLRAKDITPGSNALLELWELEGKMAPLG